MLYRHNPQVALAISMFEQMHARGRRRQIWHNLIRKPWRLLDLNDIASLLKVEGRYHAGAMTINITEIQGSVNRSRDFDRKFFPIQKYTQPRWVSIAAARLNDVFMPLVELVCMENIYYVLDGHHRISVARAFGELAVDAVVTIWNASRLVCPEISGPEDCSLVAPGILEKAA